MKNKGLDHIAHKNYENGKLVEANYVVNSPSGILQIFEPNNDGTVACSSFYDFDHSKGETERETKEIRKLSRFERDLLSLSERQFRKKYPKVELLVSRERIRPKIREPITCYED
jgi:hypothetical protein